MSRNRKLNWGLVPEAPPTTHPYRDTFIIYGVFAIFIVIVAWLTGGAVGKAVLIAVFFFVVASAWSAYRWRIRLREQAEARRAQEVDL